MKITTSQLRRIIKEETKKVVRLRVLPQDGMKSTRDRGVVDDSAMMDCPLPTQDLKLNTKNRNFAIKADYIEYGPLNLADEEYWEHLAEHWGTSVEVAKQSRCGNCAAFDVSPRMDACMPGRIQEDGELGYCHMHQFKCHSMRSCYTWAAGGPIVDDEISYGWQSRSTY